MNRNTYLKVSATVFLVVAVAHFLRIIFGWPVEIGTWNVPVWVSLLGLLVSGALAYLGFTQKR